MNRTAKRTGVGLGALLALGLLGWALALGLALPERLSAPSSTVLVWSDGRPMHVSLAPDERWRLQTDLARVDPAYVQALVAFEDQRFWWHPGVDPVAVGRAAAQNLRAGRVVSGASTLTMQLVRVVETRPRTLHSKGVEALRAAQLELRLDKAQILESYLQFAPYGRNIEGVEAASLAYFGHTAERLSAAEIATLLAVPQDPNRRYPRPENQARLRAARDDIAARLLASGDLPLGEAEAARSPEEVLALVRSTPVPAALRPMPRSAPHAAAWIRARQRLPAGSRVSTTLDPGVQRRAERALADVRAEAANRGVFNGAVVVVEHGSGAIRALVGGPDFWDGEHGGQIPAFAEPRSPGSTLKPFIYARSIEQGLVLPESLVPDIPTRYGGYAPENYDGRYDGMVSLEQALSRSLNVPFVRLLGELGTEPFLASLRANGVRSLDPRPGHYGLSAAVGGLELSPLELAGLYATLAQDGASHPLHWRAGDAQGGRQVFGAGASWLTRRALRLRDRPDFPSRWALSTMPRNIHWKTGTSFGHRDAWAVGSGQRYTVAVWLGNLDRSASRWLVGAGAAGPVLFDTLEGLGDGLTRPVSPPEDLTQVAICSLSGQPLGAHCPHQDQAFAVERAVPSATCSLHQQVELALDSGLAVRPGCREGRQTELRTVVAWPDEVRQWLGGATGAAGGMPALDPLCAPSSARPPRIISPVPGEVALLIPGLDPTHQEIPLSALAPARSGALSWFVDGALVAQTGPDERAWWAPSVGRHEVAVTDLAGRTDRVAIEVRMGG